MSNQPLLNLDGATVHAGNPCQQAVQAFVPGEQFPGRLSILEMLTQKCRCLPGKNGLGAYTTSDDVMSGVNVIGKTYLITGANSGLGLETMTQLVKAGARVLGTARTTRKLLDEIEKDDVLKKAYAAGMIVPVELELSEPSSCRAAVATVQDLMRRGKYNLDGIILNAGVMSLPKKIVKHGMELTFLTNYMSAYLLLTGLTASALTPTGRVVFVSSCAFFDTFAEGVYCDDLAFEKHRWTSWGAYAMSKLAEELLMIEFSKTLRPGQTCNSCHPGVIATNLVRHYPCWFRSLLPIMDAGGYGILKSVKSGAATQLYLAVSPDVANITGQYWSHCNPAQTSEHCHDKALARNLMETSAKIANRLK